MDDTASGRDRDAQPIELAEAELLQRSRRGSEMEDVDDKDSWEHGVWVLRRNQCR